MSRVISIYVQTSDKIPVATYRSSNVVNKQIYAHRSQTENHTIEKRRLDELPISISHIQTFIRERKNAARNLENEQLKGI